MKKSPYDIFDNKPPEKQLPRVLIDLDGVIRNFVGSLERVYTREFPTHKIQPITSRRLEDFFPIAEKIYDFMENGHIKEIMEDADAYPGAIEALEKWKNKFEIVIATAQPDLSRSATIVWIGKNHIPTNEIAITYHKDQLNGLALLDDFTENLESFAATGRLAVCLDQPWNKKWKGARVLSVEQFFELVETKILNSQSENGNELT